MEKSNNSSGDEECYSCQLPNFEPKFFAGCPPKKFENLSEKELKQLVEKGTWHLKTAHKNNKLVCIPLSRLVMHCGHFRENFLRLDNNKIENNLSL